MNELRTISAVLLALPRIVFGGNDFVEVFELPESATSPAGGVGALLATHAA